MLPDQFRKAWYELTIEFSGDSALKIMESEMEDFSSSWFCFTYLAKKKEVTTFEKRSSSLSCLAFLAGEGLNI